MPIKLYFVKPSPPVRAVLATAAAIGLELNIISITLGYLRTKEFLKLNPQHTIPVLVDDETTICDSHAIMTYLVDKYAEDDTLYPKDLSMRALVDQRLYYDASVIFPILRNVIDGFRTKKFKEVPKDVVDKIVEVYDILEHHLNKTEWIAGNYTTVADFSCYMTIKTLRLLLPYDAKKLTKLESWMTKITNIPYLSFDEEYYQMTLAILEEIMGAL